MFFDTVDSAVIWYLLSAAGIFLAVYFGLRMLPSHPRLAHNGDLQYIRIEPGHFH